MFDLVQIFPFLLCVGVGLFAWSRYKSNEKVQSQSTQLAAAQQARDKARCEAIEVGLQEWLKTLELPQFVEQRKLQEAARQLRIVLVEKLMRGPHVH